MFCGFTKVRRPAGSYASRRLANGGNPAAARCCCSCWNAGASATASSRGKSKSQHRNPTCANSAAPWPLPHAGGCSFQSGCPSSNARVGQLT
jgi:hypothetical protein